MKVQLRIDRVMDVLRKGKISLEENGETLRQVKLCDTMGWANPEQIKRTVHAIQNEWPELRYYPTSS